MIQSNIHLKFMLLSIGLQVVEEFKLHAREKKFVVRDFTYNEEELAAGKSEITKLVTDKKKQFVSVSLSVSVCRQSIPLFISFISLCVLN